MLDIETSYRKPAAVSKRSGRLLAKGENKRIERIEACFAKLKKDYHTKKC